MKKTKFWFLGIILALIYSCSDDFDAVEESPQDFGISEAQSYFETNATDLAPLMFSNPLARSTNLVMPELIPEWDKAIESIEDDYQITEIPLWSQPNVICVESIIKDYEFFAENSISCGRRLVIARGSDGKTDMFVATLIPDEKYSKNPEGAFTGRVLYSELNGKFRKAVRYKNGELEGDLLIVGAYGFAIQTEKDVPTGYSKLTFMEGNPVLRAATYSNSESGGGSWGGGGGGGGIGGGGIGGGGSGTGGSGGGTGGGYDPDYDLGVAAREKIISDLNYGNVQMVYVQPRSIGGYNLLDGAGLVTNTYGIATSCFNFLNKMTQDQLKYFGRTVGGLGLLVAGCQTYIAFTDGDITGNDILGAVSTALSVASYAFASAGFFPVAGVVGIAGCVVGIVSTMINLAGQSMLIQVPLEDGHNVYVYISPNMTLFA
ncbi:hypothetical protein [Butyricimonas virosa]|uniref:hypothetical protein n=1 Tax=Butyricimonas virosa TaxID=544645 RepID=UPI003AAA7991